MALALGIPVKELLQRITSRELSEWMAYESIEPFGERRSDLRMGILASLIANANRDRRKRSEPYEPDDFIPRFGPGE